ncbi:MAG: hypothetical protein HQM13_17735 [SAR324 cluster bacterium]|nr:hypothetical protein [SAR324 cluster bacterium]
MDINVASNQVIPSSQVVSHSETTHSSHEISAEKIRDIRKIFEEESQHLQETLGNEAHQTMLVAMYEGTENLLNKRVSEFEIVEYLETLKINAQDLHSRGVSEIEFRSEILKQSQDSLFNLLKNI